MSRQAANSRKPLRGKPELSVGKKRTANKAKSFSLNVKQNNDEEISSGDEDQDVDEPADSDEELDMETPDEKRRRLAKQYLSQVNEEFEDEDDLGVADHLKNERLKKEGKYRASSRAGFSTLNLKDVSYRHCQGQGGIITCLALTNDSSSIFTGSKDNSLVCWDTETGKKETIKAAWSPSEDASTRDGEVLAVAVSTDGQYVACGGRDKIVRVYDRRSKSTEVKTLHGHNGAISALAFQSGTLSLFSGSHDRTVKSWDVSSSSYMETAFGHQDAVLAMDCRYDMRPVTVSNDRSVRVWKVDSGSHLVFRKHSAPIDCVQYFEEKKFLSAGQDGRINLWTDGSRAPIASMLDAHGRETQNDSARWITSLASVRSSDCFASGSYDGFVRIWSCKEEPKKSCLEPVVSIPMKGFVNAMAVTSEILVAACGREHRLGRWWSLKHSECKDRLTIMRFGKDLTSVSDD